MQKVGMTDVFVFGFHSNIGAMPWKTEASANCLDSQKQFSYYPVYSYFGDL